jgi:hypothetical protein
VRTRRTFTFTGCAQGLIPAWEPWKEDQMPHRYLGADGRAQLLRPSSGRDLSLRSARLAFD